MKNVFYVALIASALMLTACTAEKTTPESAVQNYTKNQILLPKGLKADNSGLTFTLIETIDNTALVEVSGVIAVEGQIQAVKNAKGQWEVK